MGFAGAATAAVVGACGVLIAGPAAASVVFDPATGTGFVEKADLQRALGWTGAVLQRNAPGVSFAVTSTRTWTAAEARAALQASGAGSEAAGSEVGAPPQAAKEALERRDGRRESWSRRRYPRVMAARVGGCG